MVLAVLLHASFLISLQTCMMRLRISQSEQWHQHSFLKWRLQCTRLYNSEWMKRMTMQYRIGCNMMGMNDEWLPAFSCIVPTTPHISTTCSVVLPLTLVARESTPLSRLICNTLPPLTIFTDSLVRILTINRRKRHSQLHRPAIVCPIVPTKRKRQMSDVFLLIRHMEQVCTLYVYFTSSRTTRRWTRSSIIGLKRDTRWYTCYTRDRTNGLSYPQYTLNYSVLLYVHTHRRHVPSIKQHLQERKYNLHTLHLQYTSPRAIIQAMSQPYTPHVMVDIGPLKLVQLCGWVKEHPSASINAIFPLLSDLFRISATKPPPPAMYTLSHSTLTISINVFEEFEKTVSDYAGIQVIDTTYYRHLLKDIKYTSPHAPRNSGDDALNECDDQYYCHRIGELRRLYEMRKEYVYRNDFRLEEYEDINDIEIADLDRELFDDTWVTFCVDNIEYHFLTLTLMH